MRIPWVIRLLTHPEAWVWALPWFRYFSNAARSSFESCSMEGYGSALEKGDHSACLINRATESRVKRASRGCCTQSGLESGRDAVILHALRCPQSAIRCKNGSIGGEDLQEGRFVFKLHFWFQTQRTRQSQWSGGIH